MFTLIVVTCVYTMCFEVKAPKTFATEEKCLIQGSIIAGMEREEVAWLRPNQTLTCRDGDRKIVIKFTKSVDISRNF